MNIAFSPMMAAAWVLACLTFFAWIFSGVGEEDEPRAVLPPENLDDLIHEIACTTDHAKLTHLAARAMRLPAAAQEQCLTLIQTQLNHQ